MTFEELQRRVAQLEGRETVMIDILNTIKKTLSKVTEWSEKVDVSLQESIDRDLALAEKLKELSEAVMPGFDNEEVIPFD